MKVAVIGSTHAGVFAAKQIKAEMPDAEVHIYEKNQTVSFLSCGIALWIGDHVSSPDKMFYETPESLTEAGIEMHMQHEVVQADLTQKQLRINDLVNDEMATERFDKIVITTGSQAVIPNIPGIGSERVLMSKSWDDAKLLKERTATVQKVVVIGAGYIGAELAEQLSLAGKDVVLIDALERVLAKNVSPAISQQVEAAYEAHGVTLAMQQKVTGFEETQDGIRVETDKAEFEADLAILGIGFRPQTDLVANQLDTLPNGAIKTDQYMQTSVPDVYAAGDASAVFYNPTQAYDYIPLATNAIRQGMLIGKNIQTPKVAYPGTQASSAVELYELAIGTTGLTSIDNAKAKGIDADAVTITQDYRPDFMLTTTPVTVSLVWEKGSRRIIGAEFASKHDVTQSANIVSLAIENKMTIDQLAYSDFFFQPNFSQPINYLSAAALAALDK
ncbi:NADPH-dependent 2,4-dienoyl-CoA reductase/sulfur reductase-like enzyme [Weissella uvarum]|uniref:FAD-dependent oxidoreductase n=1 Tax=Weissella uvarum TaxID=1479233 RepID=UPI001960A45C|nr:FAD-dependent oxidoreductase [Weissella uvarum]MBM7617134.1 NADPH-dependent 2,4-dienoyl-CoA reductase/sulfur reductase-like enzyme [Weissella uvarum]MCM0595430.1 FAD-dependent oxidoreductase [Weissella uvarum]